MHNIFSDQDFLEVLGTTYYPDQPRAIITCNISGHHFQLLQVANQIVTEHRLIDFFQPLGDDIQPKMHSQAGNSSISQARWMARTSLQSIPASSDGPATPIDCLAPYIDWSHHQTWQDWSKAFKALAKAQAQGSGSFIDIPRQRRRLTKQLGELQFVYHDPNPALLEQFFKWKSQRYHDIGALDLWANSAHRQFIYALHQAGILLVSVLYANDQPIALHLGFERRGRFYWWLPTFDQNLQRYSAGRVLLEELLHYCFEQGQTEFDFLNGEDAYKWCYATHSRVVVNLGQRPLRSRLKQKLKTQLKQTFPESSNTFKLIKRLSHKIRS
jgi:CelD/BcsL family acetyltransferase involved in cellulose biosynthesis